MSLLLMMPDEKTNRTAKKVFEKQFEIDPKLNNEYDERRKRLMYEDIFYNLAYIDAASYFDDEKIFSEYAIWLFELLCHIMKDIPEQRIQKQLITHYEILRDVLMETVPPEQKEKTRSIIDSAILATEEQRKPAFSYLKTGKYNDIKEEYLSSLMESDSRKASTILKNAFEYNVPLSDIYDVILKDVMYEVGELWHKSIISIDKEHYITSSTQVSVSQFYPHIFSTQRHGHTILTCCIGSELHEMGIRMLSDLFEKDGWDSYYLGSAVPTSAILSAIQEHNPDLVGLSVTMPLHLKNCDLTVKAIREKFGENIKIMVGGKAFFSGTRLWEKMDVDYHSENATEALLWANGIFKKKDNNA